MRMVRQKILSNEVNQRALCTIGMLSLSCLSMRSTKDGRV
jgi:hypothetical protein